MKLTIFGATGKVGRVLTARALAAGHEVTALVRDPSKLQISHARLRLLQGDALNPEDVNRAIEGQEAVLSALGPTKNGPKNLLELNTALTIAAMKRYGLRRIVVVGGAGMTTERDSRDLGTRLIGFLISRLIPDAVQDKRRQFELLGASGLEFVILRAPVITSAPMKGHYTVGYPPMGFGAQITTADLSDAMLAMLQGTAHLGDAPAIRN